jgi:hypothetical protein
MTNRDGRERVWMRTTGESGAEADAQAGVDVSGDHGHAIRGVRFDCAIVYCLQQSLEQSARFPSSNHVSQVCHLLRP